ncbi:MAG: zinc dependent phospholipase C family protein [Gemmatimonadaceae bacterium]|nr:zinc dependent phospholipase C family protein [Gemmatimonadaceae bacterium]
MPSANGFAIVAMPDLPIVSRRAAALVIVALAVLLVPSPLYAWTPGTHVFLGEALLRNIGLIPLHIAELLSAYPADFLYGSIAADTSIAKKYAEVGRHCHSWHIGMEIHDDARTPQLRAFALGYLAHLAADVVAHNFFVPRQLAVTSSTTAVGHSYWESRIDTHIGDPWPRRARELLLLDHGLADQHLDRILSPTLFGTATNRRIFRGMVYVTDSDSWQRIFQLVAEKSRWDLSDADVGRYLSRSFDYVVDVLSRWDRSEAFEYDPSGDSPLREAKKVRRLARRQGGDVRAALEADRMFGMPSSPLRHAIDLPEPLFTGRAPKAAD